MLLVAGICNASSYLNNTALSGTGNLKKISNVTSAGACCGLCAAEAACVCWTWRDRSSDEDGLSCTLKKTLPSSPDSKPDHVSGMKHGVPTPPPTPSPPTPPPTPLPPTPRPPPNPPTKPNIVLVLTDDQDGKLNGYNDSGVDHMAELNRRVRVEGALFEKFYLAYALCSPSRSAILTGRFPHNTNFTDNSKLNSSGFHPFQEAHTVNNWLQAAGYETITVGKYMNGYHAGSPENAAHYIPSGWSSFYGFQTVDFFGTAVNMNGTSKVYPKSNYQTDIIANITLQWLRYDHDRSKPFFAFLTPHAPHAPYTPAPRHKGTLAGLKQPHDASYNLASDLQALLPGVLAKLPLVDDSKMDEIHQSRAEALLSVDEMIGNVIDELQAQKAWDRTYFFFACDNGYHLGQHRLPPGKREAFEHDINVPFLVRGPGIPAGSTRTEVVMNIDLAATFIELAGGEKPANAPAIDGRSMVPLLLGKPGYKNRTVSLQEGYQSCEAGHGEGNACSRKAVGGKDEIPPLAAQWAPNGRDFSALRFHAGSAWGEALYVEYCNGADPDKGHMLFNMSSGDVCQTKNLWGELDSATKGELAVALAAVVDCQGSACP